ncbi:MAG: hypothetical protein LBN95_10875 [Prevotellaceae bacterium]|nr:hypothetical protein [Prevotellaceae bacterium]
MSRFYQIFILAFWLLQNISAQQTTVIPSSFVAGNASVAYREDWIPFHNPAALAGAEKIGFALLYENRYITKELANKALNVWFPTKYINVGVAFSHFGYSEYNEMISSISFAREFGEKFRLGAEIDYYTVFLSQSERYKGAITAQVGAQILITENFSLAFNVFNPVFSKIKTDFAEKRLPTIFSIGSLYRIKNRVDWLVQFDKEVSSPLRWATGFEYSPVKEMVVRLGAYGYNSFIPTLGAGAKFGGFRFDINAAYNSALGFSLLGRLGCEF